MAPGGTLFRFPPHFGENVLPHGSHEWLPYSKDEVRLRTVNNNLLQSFSHPEKIPCRIAAAAGEYALCKDLRCGLVLILPGVQIEVIALLSQQFPVGSLFHDFPILNHQNDIRVAHS